MCKENSRIARPQLERGHVATDFDHVEADVLEHLGDGGSVVRRVGERNRVLVARVADDERNAFFRERGRARGAPQGKADKQIKARAHAVRPRASAFEWSSSAYESINLFGQTLTFSSSTTRLTAGRASMRFLNAV
jgi:hypothetical protein